jgi:dihydrofolate reductase
MSQRVCQIQRDLVIADQWTEPHSPWHNPAELNGVKYLKSHAQVLLDRTGAPDKIDLFLTCYPKLS